MGNISDFEEAVVKETVNAAVIIPESVREEFKKYAGAARGLARSFYNRILENMDIAREGLIPVCQDTGIFEIWIRVGRTEGFDFSELNLVAERAVARAHKEGGLRMSMPKGIRPVVHVEHSGEEGIDVLIAPRGFGSENYTFLHMMNPESGMEDIARQVTSDIDEVRGRPCPPYFIGLGIGGTASKAVELSSRALAEIDFNHSKDEQYIINILNSSSFSGVLEGLDRVMAVKILEFPAHIAGLAVGVHVGCWCNRYRRFRFDAT